MWFDISPVALDIGGYLLNFTKGSDAIQRSHYNTVTIDGSPNIVELATVLP